MTRSILLTLLVGGIFVVSSCKKNRVCSCNSYYTGGSTLWASNKDTVLENMSKEEAKSSCNAMDKSSTLLTETLTVECELK